MSDSDQHTDAISEAVEELGYCNEAGRDHIEADVSENEFGEGYHCFWCGQAVVLDE